MKKISLLLILTFFTLTSFAQNEFYELRVYTMKFGSPASGLHQYLEHAFIPALNKEGVKNIGVFEENGQSQPSKIYLIIPYESMAAYERIGNKLKTDAAFKTASADYNAIPLNKEPYSALETSFFTAFSGIPRLIKPAAGSMLFEMRTYMSHSEDAFTRKVKMFNEGELKIFDEVGLHSVLFGEKIAGTQMPCLTYMLAFKDMEERDANWAKFGPHPDWQRISKLPEYADAINNIDRVFLKPLKYSQM